MAIAASCLRRRERTIGDGSLALAGGFFGRTTPVLPDPMFGRLQKPSATVVRATSTLDSRTPLGSLLHERREEILEIAGRHRARAVRVFGSVARGDATGTSDVDLLVDFEPGSSLFDLLHLTEELEELLGHSVDVVSAGALKSRDRRIVAEAVDL